MKYTILIITFILKRQICSLECICLPAVFAYESFLLFVFYYLLLKIPQCTSVFLPVQSISSSSSQGPPCPHCSTSPLGQCWLGRGHRNWDFCSLFLLSVLTPTPPLVCSFHSVVFSFFIFFQLSFVWSYFVLQFDNP